MPNEAEERASVALSVLDSVLDNNACNEGEVVEGFACREEPGVQLDVVSSRHADGVALTDAQVRIIPQAKVLPPHRYSAGTLEALNHQL